MPKPNTSCIQTFLHSFRKTGILTVALAASLAGASTALAQSITVTSTCNSVVVTDCPSYPNGGNGTSMWLSTGGMSYQKANGGCTIYKLMGGMQAYPLAFLQKLSNTGIWQEKNSSGQWVNVTNQNATDYPVYITNGVDWTSLEHGTYRVRMKTLGLTPTEPSKTNFGIGSCSSVDVRAVDGSFVGKLAFIQPGVYYSNEVIVGETTLAETVYEFVSNGTGGLPGFDYTNPVKIDFSGSKNYDQVWVAVSEQGGWNRWAGKWWVGSEIPSNKIINLRDF